MKFSGFVKIVSFLPLSLFAMDEKRNSDGCDVSICVTVDNLQRNPSNKVCISCVISNSTLNAISFFHVDDDFGYVLEGFKHGQWVKSSASHCATGRKMVRLEPSQSYRFNIKLDVLPVKTRILIEYWEGSPFVAERKVAVSRPFCPVL